MEQKLTVTKGDLIDAFQVWQKGVGEHGCMEIIVGDLFYPEACATYLFDILTNLKGEANAA